CRPERCRHFILPLPMSRRGKTLPKEGDECLQKRLCRKTRPTPTIATRANAVCGANDGRLARTPAGGSSALRIVVSVSGNCYPLVAIWPEPCSPLRQIFSGNDREHGPE